MTEDFSNHPMSIGEVKAERMNSSGEWTARDVLIATLRDIDSGELKLGACCVVYAVLDEKGNHVRTGYRASYQGLPTMLGLLNRAQFLMNQD